MLHAAWLQGMVTPHGRTLATPHSLPLPTRAPSQAVGVTHNKLGDLLYLQGRLREALPHYERALGVRRGQLAAAGAAGAREAGGGGRAEGAAGTGEEEVHDACDLAASLCKVADLLLSMCSGEGAGGAQGEVGAGEEGGAAGRHEGCGGAVEERERMVERARGLVQEAREVLAARGPGSVEAGKEKEGEEGRGAGRGQLPPAVAQRYGRVAAAAEQLAERLKHVSLV